ncbi:hypothetical protein VNO78_04906 [Psophocarpus tetragonolobus]|uniref:TMEM205-like domain-containing protein n=1 Tax=Psophocarpus tetragonolobus TaxID=3891 RepID=A0AAN9XQH1_PSOTE
MMNVLGLSLVITSLAAAGILSPQQKQGASTIVKEGHRVVVVEYDEGGHQNTKISISPEQPTHKHDHDDEILHSIKEAASVLPNLGQGISQEPQDGPLLHAPRELICDAYGKCKHKISDAMEKTKEKAQEAIHKKKDEARQVSDAVGKTKESVYRNVHETAETAKEHVAGNVSNARNAFRHAFNSFLGIESLNSFMGFANLLGFSTAYGMCVWVTFISSYVQSRAMPRQQFAVVQSKIYPVYFRAMSYCVSLALFAHVLRHNHLLQAYNLVASLVTLFVNSLYLEPRASKLMFERIKIEKEEGRGMTRARSPSDPIDKEPSTTADQDAVRSRIIKLNDKLKKLNSSSSFLNILNLMSLTWHLVYLAQQLNHTC